MANLGGFYYEKQKYDLAEKYYLMSFDVSNHKYAASGLGYIYYYGRTGERDYKKAFYYYSIAAEQGDNEAKMKILDMYHNGYGVSKDDDKYKELLISLYNDIKNTTKLFEPYPEISHRYGEILINEGKIDEAIKILYRGLLDFKRAESKYDKNLIEIYYIDNLVGYVPEQDSIIFARLMDAGKRLNAKVKSISSTHGVPVIDIDIYLIDF